MPDWVLIMDADEVLEFERPFQWPQPGRDGHFIESKLGNLSYSRLQLINPKVSWRWEGVVHELLLGGQYPITPLDGVTNHPMPDGARSGDPDKFVKDAM